MKHMRRFKAKVRELMTNLLTDKEYGILSDRKIRNALSGVDPQFIEEFENDPDNYRLAKMYFTAFMLDRGGPYAPYADQKKMKSNIKNMAILM